MLLDNFARSINATRVRIQSRGGLIFLGLALLLGGGGRSHPALTAILELSAILLLWAQMGHPRAAARPLILKLALALWAIWFFWLLVQIIALPPGIWQALPGREAAVAIYEAAGWSGAWHAISLTPDKSFAHLLAAFFRAYFFDALATHLFEHIEEAAHIVAHVMFGISHRLSLPLALLFAT